MSPAACRSWEKFTNTSPGTAASRLGNAARQCEAVRKTPSPMSEPEHSWIRSVPTRTTIEPTFA
jgi:hypothetical protein